MYPWSRDIAGRLDEHVLDSSALRGNPLGDPHRRPLWVYVPPGYDEAAERLPSVYVIQGLTGQLDAWRNRPTMGAATYPEQVDELFATGGAPPCVVVWVDAWTSVGGSQFLDSPAIGRYHTYLCEEVVAFVDERYRTLPNARHRAIQGKSSGGYGAMVTPMLRPDLFGGLATHAGDALFECCYLPSFGETARALERYGGSFDAFWADFRARPGIGRRGDEVLLNTWAMAAAYSAQDDGTVLLPLDVVTGELDEEVWRRWLAWDPVRMAREPRHAQSLSELRAVWVDAGRSDEYFLDRGALAFHQAVVAAGCTEVHFELFEGTHGGIGWRYPLALRYLAEHLTAAD